MASVPLEVTVRLTQAERAFDQYKQSVTVEAELPTAKKDKIALEKDQQVVEMSARIIEGLKKKPELFNGIGGLLLLTTLDDASRNAALCSGTGMSDVGQEMLSKLDTATIYRIMMIAQTCVDASAHLYTVSESVNVLFERSIEAQDNLNQLAMNTVNECSATLKTAEPKKSGKQ